MQLNYNYFANRYADVATDELLRIAVTSDLTDDARHAMRDVLRSRGLEGDRLDLAVVEARQSIVRSTGVTNHCDYCGKSVLLGAIRVNGQKFCCDHCRHMSHLHAKTLQLAPDLVLEHALRICAGACPRCDKTGDLIEMRPLYTVISALIWHDSRVDYRLLCRSCAVRENWWSIGVCVVFGWWSLPGLFATPAQIWRNLRAIARESFEAQPTQQLLNYAAFQLAETLDQRTLPDSTTP